MCEYTQLQYVPVAVGRSGFFYDIEVTSDLDGMFGFFFFTIDDVFIMLISYVRVFSLQGLTQKSKQQLESLRKLADHGRNYHEYRSKLRNTAPPAVPFLGLYLTDVTFCREGNPSHRTSPVHPDKKLLNFNKYHKLARIVQGSFHWLEYR